MCFTIVRFVEGANFCLTFANLDASMVNLIFVH